MGGCCCINLVTSGETTERLRSNCLGRFCCALACCDALLLPTGQATTGSPPPTHTHTQLSNLSAKMYLLCAIFGPPRLLCSCFKQHISCACHTRVFLGHCVQLQHLRRAGARRSTKLQHHSRRPHCRLDQLQSRARRTQEEQVSSRKGGGGRLNCGLVRCK
jgi:hypothetical protein